MRLISTGAVAALLALSLSGVSAQDAEPAAADQAAPLAPFVASYDVISDGNRLGEATLELVRQPPPRWRVDLVMRGTGLFKIAGINAEQSTVFDVVDAGFRPVSQSTLRKTLFTRRKTVGIYDWPSSSARWQGDLKETRRAPVPLQPGDLSGLLINLAVIRDARPGATLEYRFVDNGRARLHRYAVAQDLESVSVADLAFKAMRVTRQPEPGSADTTVIWVVDGVPTPIRILQRENGQDTYDLRLVEYTGAPS